MNVWQRLSSRIRLSYDKLIGFSDTKFRLNQVRLSEFSRSESSNQNKVPQFSDPQRSDSQERVGVKRENEPMMFFFLPHQ